jgi:hypothetical protein
MTMKKGNNMRRLVNIWGYIILIATIIFHLWLNFPETQILADPNDNIFQFELVARSDWVWQNYDCPFSLSCLPNLVDHNVTAWAEGYPLPFYYSHIPQMFIVSTYHMIVKPIVSFFSPQFSVYEYYNWVKYLLLGFFPLPIFIALRLVGFSPFIAAIGAFFGSNFSTDGLYGIDPPSFLWRGYGLSAQLYAQFFLPLAIAYTYKAVQYPAPKQNETTASLHKNNKKIWHDWNINIREIFWASFFIILTTAGHLGIGIIALLSTIPLFFLDLKKSGFIYRGKKLFLIYAGVFFVLAYWIFPILIYGNYHIVSFWDPIWKFNSYGWYESIRQFLQGELFDWKRPSVITFLVIGGFFVMLVGRQFPFALLLVFWILLYFGRTTWGGLIDLIPSMKDFHLHRFLVGIQAAGLFLVPGFIAWLETAIYDFFMWLIKYIKIIFSLPALISNAAKNKVTITNTLLPSEVQPATKSFVLVTSYVILFIFLSVCAYVTLKQTLDYAYYNNKWIKEANVAYKYDEKNYQDLVAFLNSKPYARIYAGRPGNWGREFKLGSTETYMLLSIHGFDITQFLPETWSMMSENDQNFDERVAQDYDLLNTRYVVAPKNQGFSDKLQSIKKFGPFEVFEIPTTGWFDVVTANMMVKTDKTNFLNLVSLWHRSYPRTWNMHPLITVDKNPEIPAGLQRIIIMTNEVDYKENGVDKNIYSDFPLTFPAATVSGQIKSENARLQNYSAVIDVPANCTQCYAMFKMSYHPDWQAKVDGKPVSKFAVFPYYLAAPVTPGIHSVEFEYKPNTLKIILLYGEILTVVGFIAWKIRKRITMVNK